MMASNGKAPTEAGKRRAAGTMPQGDVTRGRNFRVSAWKSRFWKVHEEFCEKISLARVLDPREAYWPGFEISSYRRLPLY